MVPRKGHKGHIVKKILEDARARRRDVDFVLCMGDDISDEKMFTVRYILRILFIFDVDSSLIHLVGKNETIFRLHSPSSIFLRDQRARILTHSTWQLERNRPMLHFT